MNLPIWQLRLEGRKTDCNKKNICLTTTNHRVRTKALSIFIASLSSKCQSAGCILSPISIENDIMPSSSFHPANRGSKDVFAFCIHMRRGHAQVLVALAAFGRWKSTRYWMVKSGEPKEEDQHLELKHEPHRVTVPNSKCLCKVCYEAATSQDFPSTLFGEAKEGVLRPLSREKELSSVQSCIRSSPLFKSTLEDSSRARNF